MVIKPSGVEYDKMSPDDMVAISFMKDAKKYMENLEKSAKEKGEN